MVEGEIKIGDYTLCEGHEENAGKIWIEHKSGEGGDFSENNLSILLDDFYKRNF